ncbi:MAG TPA: DNA-3-methyladenine glycosylase [Fimbriimonadaceae bacterium]|nr:DNA-3-methyladenine glycosylase [Fimbriimonadaceae bacterium]
MTREELRRALEQDVVSAAPLLLGWRLVYGDLVSQLVEVEAYGSTDDPGSHAFTKIGKRNRQMFAEPGSAYVYFTYGNHWMLNIVAHPAGEGGAVLFRGAKPLAGSSMMVERRPKAIRDQDLLSGPGKICAAYGIDISLNGIDLLHPSSELRLEPGVPVKRVLTGTRIGIAIGKGEDLVRRFIDADEMQWASRPHLRTT